VVLFSLGEDGAGGKSVLLGSTCLEGLASVDVDDANLGYSVSAAGDLDGDGHADWLVGAPGGAFSKLVLAYSSKRGERIWAHRETIKGLEGEVLSEIGIDILAIGDIDGDSTGDFAVFGGDYVVDGFMGRSGSVRVLSGRTGEPLWVTRESSLGAD
jgi:hypothetical protein